MLTFAEFKKAFLSRARELHVPKATDRDLRASYETYKYGVQFANARGLLNFVVDEDGKLSWELR